MAICVLKSFKKKLLGRTKFEVKLSNKPLQEEYEVHDQILIQKLHRFAQRTRKVTSKK